MKFLRQFSRAAACCALVSTISACSEKPTEPKGEPGIRIVSGAGVTDTIDAFQTQPVVVEVRRADGGLALNVPVRFSVPPFDTVPGNYNDRRILICRTTAANCGVSSFAVTIVDTTDASGLAKIFVRMGRKTGPALFQVSVPTLGFADTAAFTVLPGAATRVRALSVDTSLMTGGTATLRGIVADRIGNERTGDVVTASLASGTAIGLNATTGVATAQALGTQSVYFKFGNFTDSTIVRVVPPGRLVAVNGAVSELHMFNTDGSNLRVLATGLTAFQINASSYPRFDFSRQRVSLQWGTNVGQVNVSVVDTATLARRNIDGSTGINSILTTRVLADGTLLVLAQRNNIQGYSLLRIEPDNSATIVAAVPGLVSTNGLADISPDGTRIVYGVTSAPTNTAVLRILTVATGAIATYEAGISFPRWSRTGDKVVFGVPGGMAIMNADGTGRRLISTTVPTGAMTWSGDDLYILATVSGNQRVIRVSDGLAIDLRFKNAAGANVVYREPDWR